MRFAGWLRGLVMHNCEFAMFLARIGQLVPAFCNRATTGETHGDHNIGRDS